MDTPILRSCILRGRAAWVLAALAAAACLTPTDPGAGRVAELRVRASFAPGSEPEVVGVSVDSATVTATPPDGEPAVVDTTVPYTDLDAALSWIVDLDTDSTEYAVRLVLRGAGRTLYDGIAQVLLQRLPLGEAPVHGVPVAYAGPGAVATVTVAPGTVTLTAAGTVQQFTAEARDADGTVLDVGFAWSSSDASVASADAATGLVTAQATGVTTVTATAQGVDGTATLTVALGGLVVELTPVRATIPAVNATQQFIATARDAGGTPITDAVFTWTVADPAIATVDGTGTVTGLAEGATVVTAETGGTTDTADLLVAVVTTIDVTPAGATLAALGDTQAFTAVARDAAGDPVPDVTFHWASSAPATATVDSVTGVATAQGDGSAVITATAGTASGSASLTVAQVITTVEVDPPSATLTALGGGQQFTAVARDANGNPVAATFAWSSSDTSIATVDAVTGLATAVATGEVTITAAAGGLPASAQLIVAPGGVSVDVTPDAATLTALGTTQPFTATARDGSGTVIGGATIVWTVRDPGVLSVDTAGLATAVGEGTTWVVAAVGTASDSAEVQVAVATTVEVTPAVTTLTAFGAVAPFTALARDAGGAVIPGATFAWSSADPAVATIDSTTGLATALANGTVSITARTGNATGTASLAVAQTVAGIAVTPASASLAALAATQQFTALALDANGHPITRTVTFAWTSTDPATATVDGATGLATAVADGTIGILATADGVTGGVTLTVDQVVVTVTVTPPSATLTSLAATQVFSATGRDANGFVVTDASFAWTSSDSTVASIDPTSGLATAVGPGSTDIRATDADGAFATAPLLVAPEPVTVEIQPDLDTLRALGQTRQFVAVARDANGNALGGVNFAWASQDSSVAGVDGGGLATALADGLTLVTATAPNGVFGSATLVVAVEADVTWSTISADPVEVEANNDDQSIITVRLFDAGGSPLTASGGVVALTTTLGQLGAVVDNNDGTYRAALWSADSGTAVVTGTLDGTPITDTARVRFTTDVDRATITADPLEVVANTDVPSIVTVQLFDVGGIPRTSSGGTVALFTSLGTLSAVTDLGNGTYRASLWSTVAGTAVVTGTLNGAPIADDAQVQFTGAAQAAGG